MQVELQNLDIAMKVQANLQNKVLDQQANVLQLIESATGSDQNAGQPSDGVRGKLLDIIA